MACCDSATDVRYEETHGDIFYFQVVDKEIEQDNFTRSRKPLVKWIKNKDHNFLIVQHEDQLLFKELQKQEQSSCDCKFKIEPCRRDPSNPMRDRGKAVLLYAFKNGKYKLVCCDDQGTVHVDTQDSLPDVLKDTGHKALFFLRSVTAFPNIYKIEPSLCQSHLLGFDSDANDPSLLKLSTLPQQFDEVDDRCNMELK